MRRDEGSGVAHAELLGGKEMSFNNYVDADAAWQLVCDFEETACAIIKHTNPSGVGTGATLEEAYRRALATDPVSAFGGIVAFNRVVDEPAARAVMEIFTEVVIAPDYSDAAIEALQSKKNLRILRVGEAQQPTGLDFKRITSGLLVQTRDSHRLTPADLKVVTKRAPTDEEIRALLFAWTVCKHTKSNAIIYARDGQTVGVGAGQMSRVDSVRLGAMRAQLPSPAPCSPPMLSFPSVTVLTKRPNTASPPSSNPAAPCATRKSSPPPTSTASRWSSPGVRHFRH